MKLTRSRNPTAKTYTLTFELTDAELGSLNLKYDFQRVWQLNKTVRDYINFLQRYVQKEQDAKNPYRNVTENIFNQTFGQTFANNTFQQQFANAQRILRDEPPPIPEPAWCKILGLPRTATQEEIKATYRKLAQKHHPDKGGDPDKFNQINQAYKEAIQ